MSAKHIISNATNPLHGQAILLGDPQAFDTDFFATVDAFPYIRKPAGSDWVTVNSGEVAGNAARGWEDLVVATDCLKFVQTSSGNVIGDWGYIKGLQTLVCQLLERE